MSSDNEKKKPKVPVEGLGTGFLRRAAEALTGRAKRLKAAEQEAEQGFRRVE